MTHPHERPLMPWGRADDYEASAAHFARRDAARLREAKQRQFDRWSLIIGLAALFAWPVAGAVILVAWWALT